MAWLNCTACENNPPRLEDASETTLQETSAAIGENNTDCPAFFFSKIKKNWKILRSHFNSRVSMFVNYEPKLWWFMGDIYSLIISGLFVSLQCKLIHIFVHNKYLRRYNVGWAKKSANIDSIGALQFELTAAIGRPKSNTQFCTVINNQMSQWKISVERDGFISLKH